MKRIVVITTGGTIAMKNDPQTGGLIPAVSGADLIEAIPDLKHIAELEVVEFSNVPSGYVTPEMMLSLAKMADKYAEAGADGIVVTHGTDTMEETAYILSLACKTNKPVVITGAMRGASDMGYDGPANILAAVKVASCDSAIGKGALLVMNDEIHSAAEVTKGHTVSCSTFISPGWGPIGHVYFDGVVFRRSCEKIQKIVADKLEHDVELLKVYAGMDDFLFKCLADKPVKGLVVEAVGCGNVPPAVMRGIEYVRSKGIPVVLATRVASGRVVPVYSYLGSAGYMESLKLIYSGEVNGPKARLKLMLALGSTSDLEKIKSYFTEHDLN